MNFRGGGVTCNQAPSSVLAESNVIKRHPEPKAKDLIKKQEDSSVASLLQNDVQGAWEFFGLCAQNDKAAQGDSSGICPQNDIKKDVILSQRRRIQLKHNWILHSVQNDKQRRHSAFTMAEVLITLGIIGIVAAMTMPALIANHRKQVMLSKVKHTYNIIANAFERAKVDHGTNINYWYIPDTGSQLEKSIFFVENYLLPYLNAPIYCADKPTAPYCFYQIGYFSGDSFFNWGPADNNSGTALLLSSGVTVSVTVGELATLDPDDPFNESINRIRILFDIDGPKGYNRYGYDVFWLELGGAEGRLKGNNADKNKILPYGYDLAKSCDYYVSNINYACRPDVQYSGGYCLAYIVCNGWDAGKKYPW